MADVLFKNPFAVLGHKFDKGLQTVPDDLLKRVALPSSAEIVDEAKAAEIRAEQQRRAKEANDPKSLKELRSGRKALRPLGKQDTPAGPKVGKPRHPSPPASDAPGVEIGALRQRYKDLSGKNASPAWKADQLQDKIAELQK